MSPGEKNSRFRWPESEPEELEFQCGHKYLWPDRAAEFLGTHAWATIKSSEHQNTESDFVAEKLSDRGCNDEHTFKFAQP